MQTHLHDEVGHNTEEGRRIVELVGDQGVELIHTKRGQLARDLDHDRLRRAGNVRLEGDAERIGGGGGRQGEAGGGYEHFEHGKTGRYGSIQNLIIINRRENEKQAQTHKKSKFLK
jgi:hypothetical protein